MPKIDAYLRSIEKFGATGAVLTSGQAVTLRFPSGDRNATQITPHDQLVQMVREVAPPNVISLIDQNRPAQFDLDSGGFRYTFGVAGRAGAWQVAIMQAGPAGASPAPAARMATPPQGTPAPHIATPPQGTPAVRMRPATPAPAEPPPPSPSPSSSGGDAGGGDDDEFAIERGQYEGPGTAQVVTVTVTTGGTLLDQLVAAARAARASDLYLATGAPAMIRGSGELSPVGDRASLDADAVSRDLGVLAPAAVRTEWSETGSGTFTYRDDAGFVRATLSRDHRGPSAALRLLGEAPALDRMGLPRDVAGWLDQRGLVLVAGPAGSGKTTTLAALVRALGERRRRVIMLEEAIEIVVANPSVSQRATGTHVPDVAAGIATAVHEGADVIAIGNASTPAGARATIDAVAAGLLVLAAVSAPQPRLASAVLLDQLPLERRELAKALLAEAHLGTLGVNSRGGQRTFEVTGK